jgi:decaprenylphospho-beta-D-ribofuranose 2-oxidase
MTPDDPTVALSGWGRSSRRRSIVRRPATDEELIEAIRSGGQLTVRGAGRSYGDAALPEQGIVLDLTPRNRVLKSGV